MPGDGITHITVRHGDGADMFLRVPWTIVPVEADRLIPVMAGLQITVLPIIIVPAIQVVSATPDPEAIIQELGIPPIPAVNPVKAPTQAILDPVLQDRQTVQVTTAHVPALHLPDLQVQCDPDPQVLPVPERPVLLVPA